MWRRKQTDKRGDGGEGSEKNEADSVYDHSGELPLGYDVQRGIIVAHPLRYEADLA